MPMVRNYYNATYLDSNGNRQDTFPSEPWNFKSKNVIQGIWGIIPKRQPFLLYIYTTIFNSYDDPVPVIRPMFFLEPNSVDAYNDVEGSFMLGKALKVSPVIT